jgi:hypothetical protein
MDKSPSAFNTDGPSRVTDPQAWYSASIVDAAVVNCFLLLHETAPPYITITQPVMLRRVLRHATKFAAHQTPMVDSLHP